ncbi:MAG: hypothetical protein HBSAPP03_24530 [Phycisphaerae bacterium]|nr:MAG: hypothetical protein HBSAPP03_24530 [Phycisphaerae bacterium]
MRTTWIRRAAVAAIMTCGGMAWAQDSAPKADPPKDKQPEKAPAATPGQPEKSQDEKKERYVYVNLKTTLGEIVLELDGEKAPISVKNFVEYLESGHYDGTIFHRVIPGFMVQGGGFDKDMKQKSTKSPIRNEWKNGLKNVRGSIAMARTSDPNSATSQFFINVADNAFLDQDRGDGAAYAVFGKVVKGLDVCDRIVASKTVVRGGMRDVPETPIVIEKATKLSAEDGAKAKGGS